ncbi:MAG: hypothetical protein JWO25_3740 [Alphaproteobacteria bacterium]|nr:hypothetical protein [Alphaproteobacteria bacterium]
MPETRALGLFRWGEALRRERRARRAGRLTIALAAGAAASATGLAATLISPPAPRLVWNASASSPVGLYRVTLGVKVQAGDMVIAWPPEPAGELAARRGYLPATVPLVKRVGAVAGDRVCAAGEALFVNGRLAARRLRTDRIGRPLPWWAGCADLGPGELLLLAPTRPDSFDGRYFGVTQPPQLIGRAVPLWTR